ncbi:MAG: DUF4198 domain-containing protein [Dethiobacter sp.]|jgi:uncharacterized GH25 family protein|nr:DUF4198 domain-containing protein [Dethiobacter sp.]
MKIMKIVIFMLIFMLILSGGTFAHEVWIEMKPEGEVGQQHIININWGDFGQFLDPRSSYFNSIIKGELWVLAPDGQKINLEPEEWPDRYVARFTPQAGGDHQVIFYHHRGVINQQHGEPKGLMTIEVISKAFIDIEGEAEIKAWDQVAGLPLEVKALTDVGHLHTGGEVKGQLLFFGEPLADINMTIYPPGGEYDEPLRITTDRAGQFSFIADKEGAWLIKVSYLDDSVKHVDGHDVIGARYNFTMTVFPHYGGGDSPSTKPAKPAGNNIIHYLYLLAGALVAGAAYMFGKSKSS